MRFGPLPPSFTNTYSLNFDGIDDYVNCGDILDFTGDFSLSVRFKTTSDGVIIGKDDNAGGVGNNRKFLLQVLATGKGRFLVFHTNESTFASVQTSTNVDDGNWHHLVGVNDTSGNMKIYLDGADDSASVVSGVTPLNPTTVDLYIGAREFPTSELYFNGTIDEPSAYPSALNSVDITTIYNSGTPNDISSLNPVAWYRFEEGSGTTAIDSGTGGNNGTINGATYSTDVPT